MEEQRRQSVVKTWDEIYQLKRQYGFRCLKCGVSEAEAGKVLDIDHVIPFANGGANDITNYQPLCEKCNLEKRTDITDYRLTPHPLCTQDADSDTNALPSSIPQPKTRYATSRRGMGGRKKSEQPMQLLRLAATPDEIIIIQSLTPRERAEAMIKATQEKKESQN